MKYVHIHLKIYRNLEIRREFTRVVLAISEIKASMLSMKKKTQIIT